MNINQGAPPSLPNHPHAPDSPPQPHRLQRSPQQACRPAGSIVPAPNSCLTPHHTSHQHTNPLSTHDSINSPPHRHNSYCLPIQPLNCTFGWHGSSRAAAAASSRLHPLHWRASPHGRSIWHERPDATFIPCGSPGTLPRLSLLAAHAGASCNNAHSSHNSADSGLNPAATAETALGSCV